MSIYVCSDVHGCFERFLSLLDKIGFTDDDTMYILGDVIDRNKDGLALLKFIMEKKNMILLMGNHEEFMYQYLVGLNALGRLDEKKNLPDDVWLIPCNGGNVTLKAFIRETPEKKLEILQYLSDLPLICLLKVNDKHFHLSHSGTFNDVLMKDKWLLSDVDKFTRREILWTSPYRRDMYISKNQYPEDYISILGHVPVQRVRNDRKDYHILHDDNIINIDGGCAYTKDKSIVTSISCLRLDDMEEYYA